MEAVGRNGPFSFLSISVAPSPSLAWQLRRSADHLCRTHDPSLETWGPGDRPKYAPLTISVVLEWSVGPQENLNVDGPRDGYGSRPYDLICQTWLQLVKIDQTADASHQSKTRGDDDDDDDDDDEEEEEEEEDYDDDEYSEDEDNDEDY